MNATAKQPTTEMVSLNPIPPQAENAAMIHMIERAARDPSVDIEKLGRLMEMMEKAKDRAAECAFNEAMSAAQAEMEPVRKDALNPQTKSKFASYAALDRAVRPIYTKHKIALSFDTGTDTPPEVVQVICNVTHGNYSRKYHLDMPADGKGAKGGDVMTKTHATTSAVSYGMRNLLKMIFNIALTDDDGNAAGDTRERITEKQAADLIDLIESSGAARDKFLKWAKVERVEDIPASHYQSCVDAINRAAKVKQ